ncbi:MAG: undecaprenyldiphospho-muramoylpentapeptide beta-N-acetylglucosaminyltransferase [Chloroflexi bacterium]|nr:undecaprenyldiphospho-muramoylpentapeptide beta-N-acetylglucosaminyltransferase [Chloroflexota bacterium]MCL5110199.1 undecaprenyldiphospho-muramoylpentapeptide beta-N-acetylglucosaminyltransferase [Chloroflexota bacterium]
MRLLVTGGGTGGHVYPALSILAALRRGLAKRNEGNVQVLYLGSRGGLEEGIVKRAGLPFRTVPTGAVVGRSPLAVLTNLVRTVAGTLASWRLIRGFRPQVLLATGGYVAVPAVLAARLAGVPSLIYLPDVTPGLAVRFLSRFAAKVAVTFADTQRWLPAERTVVTGYPVREELFGVDRAAARQALGLHDGLPVVVVLGGSRGSRSINRAVRAAWSELLPVCHILHVAGLLDEPWLAKEAQDLSAELHAHYHLYAYLHEELPQALAAADIAVSRAGASIMGEYPAVGVASVLVPYPYAGGHQVLNARQLVAQGAALIVNDGELPSGALGLAVRQLLADPERLAAMRAAARELAKPNAAQDIADLLLALAGRRAA